MGAACCVGKALSFFKPGGCVASSMAASGCVGLAAIGVSVGAALAVWPVADNGSTGCAMWPLLVAGVAGSSSVLTCSGTATSSGGGSACGAALVRRFKLSLKSIYSKACKRNWLDSFLAELKLQHKLL